jgi:hypothetical protein
VVSDRPTLFHTIFDYGNVEARVAGDSPPFTFSNVARPSRVAAEITMRIQALKVREQDRQVSLQNRQLIDALVAYHRLIVGGRIRDGVSNPATTPLALPPNAPNAAAPAPVAEGSLPAPSYPPSPNGDADGEFPPDSEYQ